MAVVTALDRRKSVRNCCMIEVFGEVLCCHFAFFNFSMGVGAFFICLSSFLHTISHNFSLSDVL